jgi:hypothetical protein
MGLKDLYIASTDKSPEISMNIDGMIRIGGRGLAINKTEITDNVLDWIDNYVKAPAEITYVKFYFEYLNSFTTTTVVAALKKLSQVMLKSCKLKIIWYYEDDDEDIVERGEYIAAALQMPIEFVATHKGEDD